jgi:hypothetical protein
VESDPGDSVAEYTLMVFITFIASLAKSNIVHPVSDMVIRLDTVH